MFTRIRECLISFVAHTELATAVLHMEMETSQQPEMAVQCSTHELLFQKTLCVFYASRLKPPQKRSYNYRIIPSLSFLTTRYSNILMWKRAVKKRQRRYDSIFLFA